MQLVFLFPSFPHIYLLYLFVLSQCMYVLAVLYSAVLYYTVLSFVYIRTEYIYMYCIFIL